MNVLLNQQKITPFGGINFVNNAIINAGILQTIDDQLGSRPAQAKFSFSDIVMNLWNIFFCGGDCAEDLDNNLKTTFVDTPSINAVSPDSVLRVLKSLATENETIQSNKGNIYTTNRNDSLNELNINIMKQIGLLKSKQFYDFDYDNEVIPTEKKDAKKTYKYNKGYFPGMATINGMPIYFENRDGNMNVKTDQSELLNRCFKLLNDNDIYIDRARADAGLYTKRIVQEYERNCNLFYIRANRCDFLTNLLLELLPNVWKKIVINEIEYEVCSIEYSPFTYAKGETPRTYRLIISRRKKKGCNQLDLFTKDNMEYRSILTNDDESSEKSIIEFYNGRGGEEKVIDVMNNDFGWNHLPFSFINENTVFMQLMIICKNIYTWLITKISAKFPGLEKQYRLKKFIFRFITVPAKWIKSGRQMILKVFSDKPYHKLHI